MVNIYQTEQQIMRFMIILTRISPNGEQIMRQNRLLYSNDVNKEKLKNNICSEKWSYDIPGFITHQKLVDAIRYEFILPKNSKLGTSTIMDAENYYIQTGDMDDIADLYQLLKNTNL